MAKRTRRSEATLEPLAQANQGKPEIKQLNPTSFTGGQTYNIGVTLQNFNAIKAAYFNSSDPLATFSNTSSYSLMPPTGAPQQVIFPLSKFTYTSSASTSAYITVTIISGNTTPVSKTFDVKFSPNGTVTPVPTRKKNLARS